MIVTRTPLRLSLGGGGTDLPDYAGRHGGFVLSATLDKYVYVVARQGRLDGRLRFSHERTVLAQDCDDLDHPITREALRLVTVTGGCDISSMGPVPAGTGLGSSGAYCVGLLSALHALRGDRPAPDELAEEAWDLERNRLRRWVGKHDHYITGLGGFRCLHIDPSGSVRAERLDLTADAVGALERRLSLFYTGRTRDSHGVLSRQDRAASSGDHHLHEIKRIGQDVARTLAAGQVSRLGELLHEHWTIKSRSARGVSDSGFDTVYEAARRSGARGGKLLGAGGGGFFLLDADEDAKDEVAAAMRGHGLLPVPFRFERAGSQVLLQDDPEGS